MIHLFWLVLIPVLTAVIAYFFPVKAAKILAILVQAAVGVLSVIVFVAIKTNGEQIQTIGGWPHAIGITFRAELFSIDMVLLSTLLFAFMFFYNLNKPYVNRSFILFFLVFQGLVNGIFLSIDLFNIFVLVELSTVIISVLIMFKQDSQSIYDGMIYLLTNIVAMAFFLMGVGILYKTLGAVDLISLEYLIAEQKSAKNLLLPYAFLITAVSLKAALMPLFSWLPKAHGTPGAPSVVSAILSGLYVKCGLYLFFRIQSVFQPAIDTRDLFLVLGLVTAVIGFVLAIAQKDIKLILAYHTVSQIGLIMTGLNMDHSYSQVGALYHIINHALFKGTLFLTAGMMIERYKTRNVDQIRGAFKTMPLVSTAALMAILGITGAPLFNGSISKYWITYGAKDTWIHYALLVVNLGTIVSFVKYSAQFWGHPIQPLDGSKPVPAENRKAPRSEYGSTAVVLTMGLLCLLGGIFSEPLTRLLFSVSMPIEWDQYVEKVFIFILMLATGYLVYHGGLKRWRYFKKARSLELSFNQVCITLVGFFVGLLIILNVTH